MSNSSIERINEDIDSEYCLWRVGRIAAVRGEIERQLAVVDEIIYVDR